MLHGDDEVDSELRIRYICNCKNIKDNSKSNQEGKRQESRRTEERLPGIKEEQHWMGEEEHLLGTDSVWNVRDNV